jgi:hypothetical protein
VISIVSEAEYLGALYRAYSAAPPSSCEERALESVLVRACERLGVDPDVLLERLGRETPVVRAADVFTDDWTPPHVEDSPLDDIREGSREHAWCWP